MTQYPPEIIATRHGGFVLRHCGPTGEVAYEGRDGYITRFPENTQPFKTQADAQAKFDAQYGGDK